MISGYDIRENTLTPNSVFLLLLKADKQGCQDVLKDLSAFCNLTDIKVKGFDYVFELSGIADDSMLEKLRVKIDSLSSSFLTETLVKTQNEENKEGGNTKPNLADVDFKKEKEGFVLPKRREIEEEVITSLELKGESLPLAKDGTEKQEEISPVEKENSTVPPFTPEELKDVAISIEHKKSIFGGFFKKIKRALNSKKSKEENKKEMQSLQETPNENSKKEKSKKGKLAASKLLKQAQEIKEKVKKSDLLKQAKGIKENISAEINKELKPEKVKENTPTETKNPFKDLGSGIIVKKGLLQAESEEIIQKEKLTDINPIEAKMQVDDIFAAETVCSFYANNPETNPSAENHLKEETKSPLEMLRKGETQKDDAMQEDELSKLQVAINPQVKEETSPSQEQKIEEVKTPAQTTEIAEDKKEGNIVLPQENQPDKKEKSFCSLTEVVKTKAKTESLFLYKGKPEPEEKTKLSGKENDTELLPNEEVKDVFDQSNNAGSLDIGEDNALHIKTIREDVKTKTSATLKSKEEEKETPFLLNTIGSLGKNYKPIGSSKTDNKTEKIEEDPFLINTIGAYDKIKNNADNDTKSQKTDEIKNVWENSKGEDSLLSKIDALKTEEKKGKHAPTILQPKSMPETKIIKEIQIPLENIVNEQEIKKEAAEKQEKSAPKTSSVMQKAQKKAVEMAVKKQKISAENKPALGQDQNPISQRTKDNKKEKQIMQEKNKGELSTPQSLQGQGEGKPFQHISKNLATKNYGNIDHTLHISAPSQGVKSKNYPIEMPLIPTYTFANMDNSPIRFAHAMGMSTLENLGTLNNPFLLQGDSGTGKTHFLHAMGYEISKKIPQSKILFTNGVRFSRGIQCLLERGKKDKLDEFFQNVEVLIIDDIHLTAVNENNREYISKILNDFLKNKKQIILSSKYPPESLKRFEELVNFKLSVGAIAELKIPNQMHFARLTKKMIHNADLSLTEDKIQEFFFEGNKSLGDVARQIKRVKVLSRRIESSGIKKLSYEEILTAMTRVKGEDPNSEIVKKEFEEVTSLQKHKGYIWGNFGFFFPSSEINKFRWVAFAAQEAAKELGIKGGFNYALKSAYSTEHIISAAFKIANICDVKGLKGAVILGPSFAECKEPIRENFYDILTHMLEVMMIRCGTINFEDIKKPSAYVKMLGDILR